jgi:3-phosphoshikimate 1-carboxyvinyltransferase
VNLLLQQSEILSGQTIKITGSKSETNRLLLLQALFPSIEIDNASDSDDSMVMTKALQGSDAVIDVHHAGTAMRFLTAYFSIQNTREVVLTGSFRMKERPIKILVDALKQLDSDIEYLEKEGYPPIKIKGKGIFKNIVSLPANVSSQYVSALLLIAPKLQNGLELNLEGEITSKPYINMTLSLLNELGVEISFVNNRIFVNSQISDIKPHKISVESDWSSASYFYSVIALSDVGTNITLSSFKENSLQGDFRLTEIYKNLGVETVFENNTIRLQKVTDAVIDILDINLIQTPDIAQTIAVTCFGLGIKCNLNGLHTLRIKETDRLNALKTELTKLGANVSVSDAAISIDSSDNINENTVVNTYQDHRMAMAFAPLAVKVPIIIEEAEVVSKSYPDFWEDLKKIGIQFSEV